MTSNLTSRAETENQNVDTTASPSAPGLRAFGAGGGDKDDFLRDAQYDDEDDDDLYHDDEGPDADDDRTWATPPDHQTASVLAATDHPPHRR